MLQTTVVDEWSSLEVEYMYKLRKIESVLIFAMISYLCYRYFSCKVSPWDAWSPACELYLWGYFVPWIAGIRVLRKLTELSKQTIIDYVFAGIEVVLWIGMGICGIMNSYMYPVVNGSYYPGGDYNLYLIPIGLVCFIYWIFRCIRGYRIPVVGDIGNIWKNGKINVFQRFFAIVRKCVWYVIFGYCVCSLLYQMIRLCPLGLAFENVKYLVIPLGCIELIMLLHGPNLAESHRGS